MLLSAKKILEDNNSNSIFYTLNYEKSFKEIAEEHHIERINYDIKYFFPEKYRTTKFYNKTLRYLKKGEYEKLKKIDLVVDVNGYFLADRWGDAGALKLYFAYREFKRYGAKVVFMPKSFGPFNKTEVAGITSLILDYTDVVFARDQVSYKYIQNVSHQENNIFLNSDFTSVCKPKSTDKSKKYANQVAFIVNHRMVNNQGNTKKQYVQFIENCYEIVKGKGLKMYFLLHDIHLDPPFIQSLGLSFTPNIVKSNDPLELKGLANTAALVISSRYHGILNALNCGTPVIGTSWAHKYNQMAKEYGIEDYIVDVSTPKADLNRWIEKSLEGQQNHILEKEVVTKNRKELIQQISSRIQTNLKGS